MINLIQLEVWYRRIFASSDHKKLLNYQKLLSQIMPEEPVYHLRFVLKLLKNATGYASVYIRLEYGGEFTDFGVTGVKVKKQGFSNFIPQKAIEVREYIQDAKLVKLILEIKETIQNKHPSNAKLIKAFVNKKLLHFLTIKKRKLRELNKRSPHITE